MVSVVLLLVQRWAYLSLPSIDVPTGVPVSLSPAQTSARVEAEICMMSENRQSNQNTRFTISVLMCGFTSNGITKQQQQRWRQPQHQHPGKTDFVRIVPAPCGSVTPVTPIFPNNTAFFFCFVFHFFLLSLSLSRCRFVALRTRCANRAISAWAPGSPAAKRANCS